MAEALVAGVFSFVSLIAIGRIIGPDAVGVAAYALAPFYLLEVSITALFVEALVQHPALRRRLAGSAVTAAVAIGAAAALALAACAPLLAAGAGQPEAAWLLLALAALLPVSAFLGAVTGLLLRAQRYRLLAMRVVVGQPVALVVCILAAQAGFGPWALVGQPIVTVLTTFVLIVAVGRLGLRPALDLRGLRELLPVAGPQFAMTVLAQARYRLLVLALGMLTTEAVVAQIHVAFRILDGATAPIWLLMSRLALPRLVGRRDDREGMARAYAELAQLQALLGLPVAVGVALVVPDLVGAFLGPEWEGIAAVVRIVGVTEAAAFALGPWISLFIAVGRARLNFAWTLAALVLQILGLVLLRPGTPEAIAVVWIIPLCFVLPGLLLVVLQELRRPVSWLARHVAPAVLATVTMAAVVLLPVQHALDLPALPSLVLAVGAGAAAFAAAAWVALGRRLPAALAWRGGGPNAPAE
jgi:O-antigen/teichoic acid export membrane protein